MNSGGDQDDAAVAALDLWLDFLAERPGFEEADFEALCARSPEIEIELRLLRARTPGPSSSALPPAQGEATGELLARLKRLSLPCVRGSRYAHESELGRGGTGVVRRVRDLELNRLLAHKRLSAGSAVHHPLAAARFLEEAHVTAQLDHPGIVPLHELGVDADGHLYFTMKLVNGHDLREILEQAAAGNGDWSQTRLLGVLLRVCEAVAYAHSKGVVHRDLKPSNIMVGSFGEVYVMDWGLARVMGRQDLHDIRLKIGLITESLHTNLREEREKTPDSPLITMDGVAVGTPAYMPPEQARGEIQLLSARSDVYSIGAILYHLLTGEPSWRARGARGAAHRRGRGTAAARAPAVPGARARAQGAREPGPAPGGACGTSGDGLRTDGGGERAGSALAGLAVDRSRSRRARQGGARARARPARLRAHRGRRAVRRCEPHPGLGAVRQRAGRRRVPEARCSHAGRAGRVARAAHLRAQASGGRDPGPGRPVARAQRARRSDRRPGSNHRRAYAPALPQPGRRVVAPPAHALDDRARGPRAPRSARSSLERREATRVRGHDRRTFADRQGRAPALGRGLCGRRRRARQSGLPRPQARAATRAPAHRPGSRLEAVGVRAPDERHAARARRERAPPAGRAEWHRPRAAPRRDLRHGRAVTHRRGRAPRPVGGVDRGPAARGADLALLLRQARADAGAVAAADGANPSQDSPETYETSWNVDGAPGNLLHPVEHVSWDECAEVCAKLALTLPSEAQWEYAARGGTSTRWWTGDEPETLEGALNVADARVAGMDKLAPFYDAWLDDGQVSHAPVGSYRANPFGLHDVLGNVWEWCLDGYDDRFFDRSPHVDPVLDPAMSPLRTARGGGFTDPLRKARVTQRVDGLPDKREMFLGLRPARALEPEAR